MLRGFANSISGDYRRRLAMVLMLVNISLIVVAALWRHAAADDPELDEASPAKTSSTSALQVEPLQEATTPAAAATHEEVASDPVLDELRKVIRQPGGDLSVPRIDETSPLGTRVSQRRAHTAHADDLLLQQRMQSVHSLSTAALDLVREARSLSEAGLTAESDVLMHHVRQLRAMIAELAAEAEGQP